MPDEIDSSEEVFPKPPPVKVPPKPGERVRREGKPSSPQHPTAAPVTAAGQRAHSESDGRLGEASLPPRDELPTRASGEATEENAGGEEIGGERVEEVPLPSQSRPFVRRFAKPGPRLPWWRMVLPAAGLTLCVGCLWGLLSSGPWPSWEPWWTHPGVIGKGLVIIDPGHGGGDSGAVAQGVVEKDLNLDVGLRVGRALRARGVTVRLTREDDHFVPLEDRVRFANALPGAVFVSIHFNDAAGEGKTNAAASGIETYYCEHKPTPAVGGWMWASLLGRGKVNVPDPGWAVREGQALAGCIQGTLIAGTGAENRGIKERSLYVTHRVLGPAVLVEGGFVSHPGEARRLGDPTYRQVLAESIAEGIVKYLRAAQASSPNVVAAGA